MDDFQHLDDHALLGVSPGATPDEIKQAYRREIIKYHPDRYRSADPQTQQYARERSQRLTEAYAALSRHGRYRPSPITGARFERSGTPVRGGFAQPTTPVQLAAWYEQAASFLAGGRTDDALRLLRQIQRIDPFYRDVDELLLQAERLDPARRASAPVSRRWKSLVWGGAAFSAVLLILAAGWGAGLFRPAAVAETTSGPAVVAGEAPQAAPAEAAATPAVEVSGGGLTTGGAAQPVAQSSEAPAGFSSLESGASPGPAPAEVVAPSPSALVTEVVPTAQPSPPAKVAPTATAAAAAQAPRATAAPPPARRPVAVESGQVLVSNNFTNPSGGWPNLQAATYSLGYQNGSYVITTEPGSGAIFAYGAPLSQGDVVLGADVTPVRGSAGLLFGPDNSYRFFITGDGTYRVELRGKAAVPAKASKAIRRGTNRLVIAAAGKRASLYANGVLLANLDLPASLNGTTYGFVVSGGGGRGEGIFDTLTVRSLPR